jgi:hypothetical protein
LLTDETDTPSSLAAWVKLDDFATTSKNRTSSVDESRIHRLLRLRQ